jgi:glutamate--cysteine ligase
MSGSVPIDQVLAAAEPAAGRWFPAAREGLEDKLVLDAARAVVELGTEVLDRTGVAQELSDQVATRLHRIVDDTQRRRAS